MNKKIIVGVIVLLCFSLVCIIGFQLYWIRQAIAIKEEQFDRNVQEALNQVANKLETREAVDVIKTQINNLEIDAVPVITNDKKNMLRAASTQTISNATDKKKKSSLTENQLNQKISNKALDKAISTPDKIARQAALPDVSVDTPALVTTPATANRFDSVTMQKIIKLNSAMDTAWLHEKVNKYFATIWFNSGKQHYLLAGTSNQIRAVGINNQQEITPLFPNSIIKVNLANSNEQIAFIPGSRKQPVRIIVGGNQELVPVTLMPAAVNELSPPNQNLKPIQTPLSSVPTPFSPALVPVEKKNILAKTNKLRTVIQRMANEYVRKSLPIEKRLLHQEMDSLIRAELVNRGIKIPFEYAVVSTTNISYMPVHTGGFKPNSALSKYKVKLFPNDIYNQANFLTLYFHDKGSFLLNSLRLMMAFSALFTLIILSTFLITIYIILKQKKISEIKNDFINNMTHEFKTPLATISLAVDSINNPRILADKDRIQHYTGIIRTENKRMNQQVEDVLQMALLDKQELKLQKEPINMHELISQVVQNMQLLLDSKQGKIAVDLNASEIIICGDEAHLCQVIGNLLDNAIKFSPNNPDLKVTTSNARNSLVIAVEDKGLGMTKETQRQIFSKFYRVSTGNIHNIKGFGLGLSYVKAIVQAHRGKILVKSELGKGSCFELVFPIYINN